MAGCHPPPAQAASYQLGVRGYNFTPTPSESHESPKFSAEMYTKFETPIAPHRKRERHGKRKKGRLWAMSPFCARRAVERVEEMRADHGANADNRPQTLAHRTGVKSKKSSRAKSRAKAGDPRGVTTGHPAAQQRRANHSNRTRPPAIPTQAPRAKLGLLLGHAPHLRAGSNAEPRVIVSLASASLFQAC